MLMISKEAMHSVMLLREKIADPKKRRSVLPMWKI